MKYKYITENTVAKIDDDGISRMSCSVENRDYLAWIEEGNTPEPADEMPPVIPQVVSRFQARAALHLAGLLDTVESIMASPTTPVLARLAWADAQEFRRNSPSLLGIAGALALTNEQLDDLFRTADGIEA